MLTGKFALIVHHDPELLKSAGESLVGAGLKVMSATSDDEALDRLGTFFVPDVVLTTLGDDSGGGPPIITKLRSNPLTRNVPVVVLANGEPEARRRSLRLGVTHIVPLPFDEEELILTTRLALEQHREEGLLSGSLEQLSFPDLLQTIDTTRRSGVVNLRSSGRTGSLWLRGGRVVDAETDDGRRGEDAFFALALWDRGTFEADFGPISVPERMSAPTAHLLLEAMRRKDEAARDEEQPPHAALPDPPPPPPRPLLAIHRALTLLNVGASYAEAHLDRPLLERRLAKHRNQLLPRHPLLGSFTVTEDGRVSWAGAVPEEVRVEELVAAVAVWLRDLFESAERDLPGRFSTHKLKNLTEAVQGDMESLGFYDALGLTPRAREENG